METTGAPGTGADGVSAFFTSYGGRRADREHVLRFHADLEGMVRLHTDDHAFGATGPTLEPGGGWRAELHRHCATTRTLVVLLSETHLNSAWCAREWWIVEERVRRFRSGGGPPHHILPLVWQPLTGPLPRAVRERQRLDWVGVAGHADAGVLELMLTDPAAYRALCYRIGALVARSAAVALPALPEALARRAVPAWDAAARRAGGDPDGVDAEAGAPESVRGVETSADRVAEAGGGLPRGAVGERAVRVLLTVGALDDPACWEAFLSRLGELRRDRALNPRYWSLSQPAPERLDHLVAHLRAQHPDPHALAWLARAVADTAGASDAAHALLALLPRDGSAPEDTPTDLTAP
ncbi:TIR domain-containing protein [Nocardiopsis sp. NPDC006938]|uniref:TIR domain-containing protein n=1 Tax=Nocardiopsis sp. NPDC006938 TaxID=3364337 RepID=UPI0036BBECE6